MENQTNSLEEEIQGKGIASLVCSVHLKFLLSCSYGLRDSQARLLYLPIDAGVCDAHSVF